MILTCPQCATRYQVDADKFPPAGRNVRCAKCGHVWHQLGPAPEPDPDAEIMVQEPPRAPEPEPEVPMARSSVAHEPMSSLRSVLDDQRRETAPPSWLGGVAVAGG